MAETIRLRRRSLPDKLRYLAGKLRDGSLSPEGAAIALEVTASLIETGDPAEVNAGLRRRLAELGQEQP